MNNDFEKVLENKKNKVWPIINRYLNDCEYPTAFKVPKKYSKDKKLHWQMVREYPERKGKYIRPSLVLLTAEAMRIPESRALQTAAAMQISEDWLLIHDDFEDDSKFRRGKPTLHEMFGEKLAVNAGDALHAIMWKSLLDNEKVLGWKKTKKIMEEFYKILARTVLGQGVEIMWAKNEKKSLSDNDWFFIADGKTSYYTIAGPMRLGAIIAEASSKQLALLTQFGRILGRCYQLVDDILDVTSDYRGLKGKIAYNDIYEGKRTLLLGHLLRNTDIKSRNKISEFLFKPREMKSEDEVRWVVREMEETGSIAYARKIAANLAEQALKMFDKELDFLSQNKARKELRMGILFILNRNF